MSTNELIERVSSHTIKKFEVIEKYVEAWSQKLANNDMCKNLVFIDCMCNSGEYVDSSGNMVRGTAFRVFSILKDVAKQYSNKNIIVYFNDLDLRKVEHLEQLINSMELSHNMNVSFSSIDANVLLKDNLGKICSISGTHCLLLYDPYKAEIDWGAIIPFLNSWSEVILNHMVYDSLRAVREAKSEGAKLKYEKTYQKTIDKLLEMGNSKEVYELLIKEIIFKLHNGNKFPFYVSSFPFFNSKNAIMYNLIHCTRNLQGLILYKKVVWQVFNGKSSCKIKHGCDSLPNLFETQESFESEVDEYCYTLDNIVDYVYNEFKGKNNVLLGDVWALLDSHPVFPSDGFKAIIRQLLKEKYGVVGHRGNLDFTGGFNQ